MQKNLAERIRDGKTTFAAVQDMGKSLDMGVLEYCKFQELKSVAMGGSLTTAEAQTVYAYLGESVQTFNGQIPAVKYILNKLFAELLERRLGGAA